MKKLLMTLVFGALALASTAAAAQTAARLRGTVVSFDGKTLIVKTAVGKELKMAVTGNTGFIQSKPIKLTDIKPGDFVGSAAMPGPDGRLVAREVHLFSEAQRGTGEGHRPMDEPGLTMTNASVDKMVKAANGQELTLQYKGGTQRILVPEATPIVRYVPGDISLLVPGTTVSIAAQTGADGAMTAQRIQAIGG